MDDTAQDPANTKQQTPIDDPTPTFVDEIKQFDAAHPEPTPADPPDYQQMYNTGGKFKEQLEAIAQKVKNLERAPQPERAPTQMAEIPSHIEEHELKEVEGYIEKIEKDAELSSPVIDDYTQQVLLKSANPQNVEVVLPLTETQVQQGLHHKVWEAITWLATWCLRQVKISPGRVKYKQEKS